MNYVTEWDLENMKELIFGKLILQHFLHNFGKILRPEIIWSWDHAKSGKNLAKNLGRQYAVLSKMFPF